MIPPTTLSKFEDQFNKLVQHATKPDFDKTKAKKALDKALNSFKVHSSCNRIQNEKSLQDLKSYIEQLRETLKNDQELNSKLSDLSDRVNQLLKYGIVKEKFVAKPTPATPLETFQKPFKALFQLMTERIADEINKMVYYGWAKKVKDVDLKQAIENELTKKYQDWAERAHAQAQTAQQHAQIDEALAIEMGFKTQAAERDERLQKISSIEQKAAQTREQLVAIGGTRVELEASDGVKLDATHLSAGKFLETLQSSKAQFVDLCFNPQMNQSPISSLAIPKGSTAYRLLRELNLVNMPDKRGAGYCFVTCPNYPNDVFLVHEQTLDNHPRLFSPNYDRDAEGNYMIVHDQNTISPHLRVQIDNKNFKQNGAAILTSGNAGVYEMHKGEALTLLMQGMDVLLLNVRGYGESEGKPSQEGSYLDVEAAYQYLHEKKKFPSSKIVAWSMCLSGGIGAYLAEKHSGMHLFLNQTYADMASMLKEEISSKLGIDKKHHPTLSSILTEIVFFALSFIAPNYSVIDKLKNIRGQVCTIQALSDALMEQKETEEMSRILKDNRIKHHRIEIPGQHSSNWTQVSVPRITVQTKSGDKFKSIRDYLKIEIDGENYYLSKESLTNKRKINIGQYSFTRPDPSQPNQITVSSKNKQFVKDAEEIEASDSRDFAKKLMKSSGYKRDSFKWDWQAHRQIDQFLKEANLSRPFIQSF